METISKRMVFLPFRNVSELAHDWLLYRLVPSPTRPSSLQFSMTRARLATQPSSTIAIATCETENIENAKAMLSYTANNPVLVFTTLSASCIQLFTFKVTACYVIFMSNVETRIINTLKRVETLKAKKVYGMWNWRGFHIE